jgi:hypothetical protein
LKSSAVGISSLGIYLLLFPGALPVAGAEDERDEVTRLKGEGPKRCISFLSFHLQELLLEQ